MAHDFNYRIAGTQLSTITRSSRLSEGAAGKRADLLSIAYKHGVYVAERHWTSARLVRFETLLRDSAAATTFGDLSDLKKLFLGGIRTFQRNDPAHGEVRSRILVADPVEQGAAQDRFVWAWPVWLLDGTWEDNTESTDVNTLFTTTGTITFNTGGDHPIEPVFDITCKSAGSNPAIELASDLSKLTLSDSFVLNDVITIDVPNRIVTKNSVRHRTALKINRGWWMQLPEDTTGLTLNFTATSGTWDVTAKWRNRYR